MVHIGCGADVIRQRRRADQLKKDNEAIKHAGKVSQQDTKQYSVLHQ